MKGISASEKGIKIVKQALSLKVEAELDSSHFRKQVLNYLQQRSVTLSPGINIDKNTVRRLLECINIRPEVFQAICAALNLKWEEIAKLSVDSIVELPPEYFFGRSKNLQEIADFVQCPSCRLIILQGLPGIGKKSLVARFVDTTLKQIPYIWENFNYGESVNFLLERVIFQLPPVISSSGRIFPPQSKIDILWQRLKERRYLVILENNNLTDDGKVSHRKEYEELFRSITNIYRGQHHQSCILLITDIRPEEVATQIREDLREVIALEELEVEDRVELLKTRFEGSSNKITQDREVVNELSTISGHPIWLNYAATNIIDHCNENNVQSYLVTLRRELSFPDNIQSILNLYLQELSADCWIILRILLDAEPMPQESIQEYFLEENPSLLSFLRAFRGIQRHTLLCRYKNVNNSDCMYGLVEIIRLLIRKHPRLNVY
jgi:AAA+ ATPase superfamily predicted ATPase